MIGQQVAGTLSQSSCVNRRDRVEHRVIGAVSRGQEVWCSEVVTWKSEFRVCVIDDDIVGMDHYAGDPDDVLDLGTVQRALVAYRDSGDAPSAY